VGVPTCVFHASTWSSEPLHRGASRTRYQSVPSGLIREKASTADFRVLSSA